LHYTIQVVSLKKKDDAKTYLFDEFDDERAAVVKASVRGTTYYRVVLGSFQTYDDAVAAKASDVEIERGIFNTWIRRLGSVQKEVKNNGLVAVTDHIN
jgi:septal ring-binding cell division protein DamX